jgi:hypothetical protein
LFFYSQMWCFMFSQEWMNIMPPVSRWQLVCCRLWKFGLYFMKYIYFFFPVFGWIWSFYVANHFQRILWGSFCYNEKSILYKWSNQVLFVCAFSRPAKSKQTAVEGDQSGPRLTQMVNINWYCLNPILHIYSFTEQCRSRSTSISVPSDQDLLKCRLLEK